MCLGFTYMILGWVSLGVNQTTKSRPKSNMVLVPRASKNLGMIHGLVRVKQTNFLSAKRRRKAGKNMS